MHGVFSLNVKQTRRSADCCRLLQNTSHHKRELERCSSGHQSVRLVWSRSCRNSTRERVHTAAHKCALLSHIHISPRDPHFENTEELALLQNLLDIRHTHIGPDTCGLCSSYAWSQASASQNSYIQAGTEYIFADTGTCKQLAGLHSAVLAVLAPPTNGHQANREARAILSSFVGAVQTLQWRRNRSDLRYKPGAPICFITQV